MMETMDLNRFDGLAAFLLLVRGCIWRLTVSRPSLSDWIFMGMKKDQKCEISSLGHGLDTI